MAMGMHILSGASVLSHIRQLEHILLLRNLAHISLHHLYTPGIGKLNFTIVPLELMSSSEHTSAVILMPSEILKMPPIRVPGASWALRIRTLRTLQQDKTGIDSVGAFSGLTI
eukprot:1149118-Pelagomonas_calceolata.AAC.6